MNNKASTFKILAKDVVYRPKEPPHVIKQHIPQHSQNIKDTVQQYARHLNTRVIIQRIIPTLWYRKYYPWYRNLLSIVLRCYLCLIAFHAIEKGFKYMCNTICPAKPRFELTADGKIKNDFLDFKRYTNNIKSSNYTKYNNYNHKYKTLDEILKEKIYE